MRGSSWRGPAWPRGRWQALARCVVLLLPLCLILCACAQESGSEVEHLIGQTVKADGWQLTLHSFTGLSPDQWRQPAPGHSFCSVDLTLENFSDQIRYMMPERQMLLLDGEGNRYALHHPAGVLAARERGWTVPEGQFDPGKPVRGAVSYEIPSGAEDLRFVFRVSLWPWTREAWFLLGACLGEP